MGVLESLSNLAPLLEMSGKTDLLGSTHRFHQLFVNIRRFNRSAPYYNMTQMFYISVHTSVPHRVQMFPECVQMFPECVQLFPECVQMLRVPCGPRDRPHMLTCYTFQGAYTFLCLYGEDLRLNLCIWTDAKIMG